MTVLYVLLSVVIGVPVLLCLLGLGIMTVRGLAMWQEVQPQKITGELFPNMHIMHVEYENRVYRFTLTNRSTLSIASGPNMEEIKSNPLSSGYRDRLEGLYLMCYFAHKLGMKRG